MVELTRRDAIVAGLALPGAAALGGEAQASAPEQAGWKRGFDDQRVADLGDGRFLNPPLAGDHPDPTILRDGADYTHQYGALPQLHLPRALTIRAC